MKRKHLLFKDAVCKNSISLIKLFVFGMCLRVRPRVKVSGVGFSVAGLDRAKFRFHRF